MKKKIKIGQRRLFRTKPRGGYISGTVVAVYPHAVQLRIKGNGPLSGMWQVSPLLVGPALVVPKSGKGKCAMCNATLGKSWRCSSCSFVN